MLLNKPRAIACMMRDGLEAIVATHPNHVTYATNYGGHAPRLYPDRPVIALLTSDGEGLLLASVGEAPYLAENHGMIWVSEVWTYGTSKIAWPEELSPDDDEKRLLKILRDRDHNAPSLPKLLARVLEAKGLAKAVIGLDNSGLTPSMHESLMQAVPRAEFRPAEALWREIEYVKTDEELVRLRRAATANEEAVGAVMGRVREGVSEAELMQAYREEVARRGGALEFWNTAGGRRAGGFFPSGAYRLRKGDLYRFDAGMVLDHYHADTGGVCVLGEPTRRQKEVYGALQAGMQAALEVVRPGATFEDVWRRGVEAVRDRGIKNYDVLRSDLGHGIGVEPRVPNIAKGNTAPLEAGMVINVEVPYYEIGYGGFQLEYSLLVNGSGWEFLVPVKRELVVV